MEGTSELRPGGLAFLDPVNSFSNLDADTVAGLVTAAADITLVLEGGVIRDVAISAEDLCEAGLASGWIGRQWAAA